MTKNTTGPQPIILETEEADFFNVKPYANVHTRHVSRVQERAELGLLNWTVAHTSAYTYNWRRYEK